MDRRVPARLRHAVARGQHHRLRRERQHRAALEVQPHGTDARAVPLDHVDDHDVVHHRHAAFFEHRSEHLAAVLVGEFPVVPAHVVMPAQPVDPVLGIGRAVVGRYPAPVDQALRRALRLLHPHVLPREVREAVAAAPHVLVPRVQIGVEVGVVVRRAARPSGKPRVPGRALVHQHDALARLGRGPRRVEPREPTAHHQHVACVLGRVGRRHLRRGELRVERQVARIARRVRRAHVGRARRGRCARLRLGLRARLRRASSERGRGHRRPQRHGSADERSTRHPRGLGASGFVSHNSSYRCILRAARPL